MVCKNKVAPSGSQNAPKSSQMLSNGEPNSSINNILHQCQYCQIICSKKSNLQRHLKKCKKKDIFILNENIQFDIKEIEEYYRDNFCHGPRTLSIVAGGNSARVSEKLPVCSRGVCYLDMLWVLSLVKVECESPSGDLRSVRLTGCGVLCSLLPRLVSAIQLIWEKTCCRAHYY